MRNTVRWFVLVPSMRNAMRWFFLLLSVVVPAVTSAQRVTRPPLRCYYSGDDNKLGRLLLAGGRYSLSVEKSSDPADAVENGCVATVRDRQGRVMYRRDGFGVSLDSSAVDLDVDGDGTRDVVLTIDIGGGNHCCWSIDVLSVRTRPRVIVSFEQQGAAGFSRDPNGGVILRSLEGGYGSDRYSMAGRVFAERIYRLQQGKLVDVTPWMCRTAKGALAVNRTEPNDEESIAFRQDGRLNLHDFAASDIESLMLQHCLCGDIEKARDVATRLWPPSDLARLLRDFPVDAVNSFPHLRGKFASWSDSSRVH
ncbi:MAG: hypothetical protein U0132_08495 [Gemmatimonadaceae bacterium]